MAWSECTLGLNFFTGCSFLDGMVLKFVPENNVTVEICRRIKWVKELFTKIMSFFILNFPNCFTQFSN